MSYLVTIFTLAGLNAILAISVYLTLATGQFSLAQVGFWAMGAYGTAALTTLYGWPLLPALLACAAVCFVVGLALGYPCLRVKGIYLALATLGFSECVRVFFLNFTWQVPVAGNLIGPAGATGFRNIAVLTQPWHVAAALLVLILVMQGLERSRYGAMLGAIQEDEAAASAMGINVVAAKMVVFALGAAVAAIGGGLYASYMSFVTSSDFGFALTMLAVLYVGAGGLGTFWGPVFGAVLLTLLPEVIRPLQEYRTIFYGLLVTAIVIVRPRGLIDEQVVHWLGGLLRRRGRQGGSRRLQGGES